MKANPIFVTGAKYGEKWYGTETATLTHSKYGFHICIEHIRIFDLIVTKVWEHLGEWFESKILRCPHNWPNWTWETEEFIFKHILFRGRTEKDIPSFIYSLGQFCIGGYWKHIKHGYEYYIAVDDETVKREAPEFWAEIAEWNKKEDE